MAVKNIVIADEGGTHFSITHSASAVQSVPKNHVVMARNGEEFTFTVGNDVIFNDIAGNILTPAHTGGAVLEPLLAAIIYKA